MRNVLLWVSMLVFMGCAKNYDITPRYDPKQEILSIADLKLKNAKLEKNVPNIPINSLPSVFAQEQKDYFICDKKCRGLRYLSVKTSSDRAIIPYNLEDKLRDDIAKRKIKNCKFTKIENILFASWKNKKNKKFYQISTAQPMGRYGGFSEIKLINTGGKNFKSILRHFKARAKKEGLSVEIEKLTR